MSVIVLTWNASLTATSYNVYRSQVGGQRGTQLGSVTVLAFTDSSASAGTPYWYGVTAVNAAGESALSAQVSATIPATPPAQTIDGFTATPPEIQAGSVSTLAWSTSNATLVTLNAVPVTASGSQVVAPQSTADYVLVASGSVPDISSTVQIIVDPPPGPTIPPMPAQTINSFTATPTTIVLAGTTTLAWNTSNATSVTLNGLPVPGTSSQTFAPQSTTTYTLVAKGSAPDVTSSITVVVQTSTGAAVYMPPAASLSNADGIWTLQAAGGGIYNVMLNGAQTYGGDGVPAQVGTGSAVALVNGTVFLGALNNNPWYVYTNLPAKPPFSPTVRAWYNVKLGITNDVAPTLDAPTRVLALPPGYVGTTTTPDWEVDFTSTAAIAARMGYPILDPAWNSQIYNPEFGTDAATGIHYMRFTNGLDPSQLYPNTYPGSNGTVLLALFLMLGSAVGQGFDRVSTRYLLWIEDDVQTGFTELGMKLPGPAADVPFNTGYTGGEMSWRMFHSYPQANTYEVQDYLYNYQHNVFPGLDDYGLNYKTGRFYVVEQRAICNTITGGVPDANGYAGVKINGHLMWETNTMIWRGASDWLFHSFHLNFYHGGTLDPRSVMHYRVARVAANVTTADWIGCPPELLGSVPTWRQGAVKDVVTDIAGTGGMAGDMPGPFGGTPITTFGKSSADIASWTGFAADFSNCIWYGVAMGGDKQQWSNKVFKVNLLANVPQFTLDYAGSTYQTSVVDTPGDNARNNDGLPKARQTYYTNYYVPPLNGVILIREPAQFCNATIPGGAHNYDLMDFYNTATRQYAPANTYPTNGVASGLSASLVGTGAQHPTTYDVYYTDGSGTFKKWSAATGNWSLFYQNGALGWGFRGSVIDATRNRWVWIAAGILYYLDLTTPVSQTINVTGDANFTADSSGDYLALVHDTDNDRYVLFCGDSNTGAAGRIYQINPTTGVCSKISDVTAPFNGWNSRVHFFPKLHAIVFLSNYDNNIQFIATT